MVIMANGTRPSDFTGVGQNPDPFSAVGRTGVNRPQHTPFRIVPHRGQVPENSSESPRSEHWGVFHEDETGSNLANDPSKFRPEAGAFSFDSGTLSCCADVLAGESPTDNEFPRYTPCSGEDASTGGVVFPEGSNIVPNGKDWKKPVKLSLQKNSSGIVFDFNSTDGSVSEQAVGKDPASCTGE
jgi:hypothetical protein